MPAPDSIKDQQSRLQALALKPSPEPPAPVRATKADTDPLSGERIQARATQHSATLDKILSRQEPFLHFGINE